MKILWLGQAGLLLVSGKTKIMIDPYLTDSLSKYNHEYARKLKVNKKLFKVKPDAIVITNNHSDHADAKSIEKMLKYIKKKSDVTILSCKNVFDQLVEIPTICQANNIMLEEGSEWTIGNLNICAVPAKTDDTSAFGIIITDYEDNKKYYIVGDTLYNKYIFDKIPKGIYATFLPINGNCGSMNLADAKRFAKNIDSCYFVLYHFGMFEKTDIKKIDFNDAIIPKPYKIVTFNPSEDSTPKKQLDSKFNEKKKKVKKKNSKATENEDIEEVNDNTDIPLSFDDNFNDAVNGIEIEDTINFDGIDEPDDIDEIAEEIDFDVSFDIPFEDEEETNLNSNNKSSDGVSNINDDEYINMSSDNENLDEDEEDLSGSTTTNDNDNEICLEDGDDIDNFIDDDETPQEISFKSTASDTDDSDKIDAYIKEIEKFERGETTDFSTID